MTPAEAKADLKELLEAAGEIVVVRIYSGVGLARTHVDRSIRARVTGAATDVLAGAIAQRDRNVILSAEDLAAAGISPAQIVPGGNTKIVVQGAELTVKAVNDDTRRVASELIGLDVVCG